MLKNENNIYSIKVLKSLYSKGAIINATYKYTGNFFINIDEDINENAYIINFKPIESNKDDSSLLEGFENEVIDSQIRIDVEEKYSLIRDEIVKKAFNHFNS